MDDPLLPPEVAARVSSRERMDHRERHQLDLGEIFGIRQDSDRRWMTVRQNDMQCRGRIAGTAPAVSIKDTI